MTHTKKLLKTITLLIALMLVVNLGFTQLDPLESAKLGYIHVEIDPHDSTVNVDLDLQRTQKQTAFEVEMAQMTQVASAIHEPVPLVRVAEIGQDYILVRSNRDFKVGDHIRIEQGILGDDSYQSSEHEIVRIGETDRIPALFVRPSLAMTYENTTGAISSVGSARVVKIQVPSKPRVIAIPVVEPALLARAVQANSDQVQIELHIAQRSNFPIKSVISIQQIDKTNLSIPLKEDALTGTDSIFVDDATHFGPGDVIEIRQPGVRFETTVKQVLDRINKLVIEDVVPVDLFGQEAKIGRIWVTEVTEIVGIPEKSVDPQTQQKLLLTLNLKNKLKRGFQPGASVYRMSKIEVQKPYYLPEKRNILVRRGEIVKMPKITLTRGVGNITILSDPSNAQITLEPQFTTKVKYLDRLAVQRATPTTFRGIPAGDYHLRMVAEKYLRDEVPIAVQLNEDLIKELNLCECSATFQKHLTTAGLKLTADKILAKITANTIDLDTLDALIFPDDVRSRLISEGVNLSDQVIVTVRERSNYWLISDTKSETIFSLRRSADGLIFSSVPLIVNVKRESEHWQILDTGSNIHYSVRREGDRLIISSVTVFIGETGFIHRKLRVDEQSPQLLTNGFQINNGSKETSSSVVMLSFAVSDQSGVQEMQISDNPKFVNRFDRSLDWMPFSPIYEWNIGQIPGEKVIWARFRDGGKNATQPISAKIQLIAPPGMIYIPSNQRGFLMGSANGEPDEQPEHEVKLSAYYIDQFEVTNAQYKEFVSATGHPAPAHWSDNDHPPGMANYPVVSVSWHDANAYAKWAGKRLPTEAEWERAALGSSKFKNNRIKWSWGDRWNGTITNVVDAFDGVGIMPVDRFRRGRTEDGLFNMCGNVWEWTNDWYDQNYYQIGFVTDPRGPDNGSEKVIRGGLAILGGQISGLTNREKATVGKGYGGIGFRCVLPISGN